MVLIIPQFGRGWGGWVLIAWTRRSVCQCVLFQKFETLLKIVLHHYQGVPLDKVHIAVSGG